MIVALVMQLLYVAGVDAFWRLDTRGSDATHLRDVVADGVNALNDAIEVAS